jgi:hypothetical protein
VGVTLLARNRSVLSLDSHTRTIDCRASGRLRVGRGTDHGPVSEDRKLARSSCVRIPLQVKVQADIPFGQPLAPTRLQAEDGRTEILHLCRREK